ncbi:MAG: HAMP domain-containing methyl-accepting chemotaxis protein [Thermaerobacter sp.]|nr:HAMP domain-containing methyl-accepting chemotaxis protein [Thermaerobacter sp.]
MGRLIANLKLGTQLFGGFLLVVVIFVVVIIYSLGKETQVTTNYRQMADSSYPAEIAAAKVEGDMQALLADIRGEILTGQIGSYTADLHALRKDLATVASLVKTPAEHKAFAGLQEVVQSETAAISWVHTYAMRNDQSAALQVMAASAQARTLVIERARNLTSLEHKLNAAELAAAQRAEQEARATGIVASVVTALLGAFWALLLTRSITTRMKLVVEGMRRIAEGDLRARDLHIVGRDEISDTLRASVDMLNGLHQLISAASRISGNIATSSEQAASASAQVAQAAQQISVAVQDVAAGASQQAASTDQSVNIMGQLDRTIAQITQGAQTQANDAARTSQTIRQVAEAMRHVAGVAQEVSTAAAHALSAAENGGAAVRKTVTGMASIQQTSAEASARVHDLGVASKHIFDIIEVISGIAEQTNLLALNAAIEAARAGEYGKGFAVVADEVRKLAENSGKATKEIATLVTSIQSGIGATVAAMEAGTSEVESGVALATTAGNALDEILDAMQKTNSHAQDISAASEEVTASVEDAVGAIDSMASIAEENMAATVDMAAFGDQVSTTTKSVAQVSAQTAASVEEVSTSTEEVGASAEQISAMARNLAGMAQELQSQISRFHL